MTKLGSAGLALVALALGCAPATNPAAEALDARSGFWPEAHDELDRGAGAGDVIIRSAVFNGEKKGMTKGEEGLTDVSTGELRSSSLLRWKSADGVLAGELVHVGLGCFRDSYLADPAGKIALIERGVCPFSVKIGLAQLAGATGVIVYNQPPDSDIPLTLNPGMPLSGEALIQMAAFEGTFPPGAEVITIPVAFVTHGDGVALAAAAPVEARMEAAMALAESALIDGM